MAAAGVESFHIGHVNAHGNSTREDDAAEAQAIRDTLGDVPVTAPKSYFGNLGHGSGMVELVDEPAGHAARRGAADAELRDARSGVPGERGDRAARRPTGPRSSKLNHNTTGQAAAVVIAGLRIIDHRGTEARRECESER